MENGDGDGDGDGGGDGDNPEFHLVQQPLVVVIEPTNRI